MINENSRLFSASTLSNIGPGSIQRTLKKVCFFQYRGKSENFGIVQGKLGFQQMSGKMFVICDLKVNNFKS